MISDFLSITIGDISIFAISLRILLSFIAGFAMGMEREVHQHLAGSPLPTISGKLIDKIINNVDETVIIMIVLKPAGC